jgi:hypothetical protein
LTFCQNKVNKSKVTISISIGWVLRSYQSVEKNAGFFFTTCAGIPVSLNSPIQECGSAVTGESKKIVFTSGATEKITSGGATSDFWSPTSENNF